MNRIAAGIEAALDELRANGFNDEALLIFVIGSVARHNDHASSDSPQITIGDLNEFLRGQGLPRADGRAADAVTDSLIWR